MTDRSRLLGHVLLRAPVVPLAVTTVIGALLTVARVTAAGELGELLTVLRLDAVVLAAAAALCLEDPAEVLAASSPLGLRDRRLLSVAVTAVLLVVAWTSIAVAAAGVDGRLGELPFGGLLIELLALASSGWMIAAIFGRATGQRGSGGRAAIALLLLSVLTLVTPQTIEWLWRGPSPAWRIVHVRWAMIGAVTFAGFLLLSRDPAQTIGRESRRSSGRTSDHLVHHPVQRHRKAFDT